MVLYVLVLRVDWAPEPLVRARWVGDGKCHRGSDCVWSTWHPGHHQCWTLAMFWLCVQYSTRSCCLWPPSEEVAWVANINKPYQHREQHREEGRIERAGVFCLLEGGQT